MAHTTAELVWIQTMLLELAVPHQIPTLMCDNLSAVLLAHNPILRTRTTHLELDIVFVREKIAAKALTASHILASMQITDAFTKPLSTTAFQELRSKLKVIEAETPTVPFTEE